MRFKDSKEPGWRIMNLEQFFSILAAPWASLNLLMPSPATRNSDLIVLGYGLLLGYFRLAGESKVWTVLRPTPALEDGPEAVSAVGGRSTRSLPMSVGEAQADVATAEKEWQLVGGSS